MTNPSTDSVLLAELMRLRRRHLHTVLSAPATRTLIADTFAEHWWGSGGCCCHKQGGVEYTYHLADLLMEKGLSLRPGESSPPPPNR